MTLADRLIAHRGWQTRYPENTLPALQAAVQAGARQVEFDIQLDAEQQPWLCHDGPLTRLCGDERDVCALHTDELEGLSVFEPDRLGEHHRGTRMARLAEAVDLLRAFPGVTVFPEIKRHSLRRFGHDAVLGAVLPLLEPLARRAVLISFDLPVLQQARARGWARLGWVLSDWEAAFSAEALALRPECFFASTELLEGRDLSALPAPVAVYEVGDAQTARHWFSRGAAFVETFALGELRQALQELGDGL